MGILQRSSCKFLWNGKATEAIKPTRGLQQGDPRSPYLFVLCMKRLSRLVLSKVEGSWRPLKASRGGIAVLHLFFTDEVLLFTKAGEDQIDNIKKGLQRFCDSSGQKINLNKSFIFFSSNLSEQITQRLSLRMGVQRASELGKYSGHQIYQQG